MSNNDEKPSSLNNSMISNSDSKQTAPPQKMQTDHNYQLPASSQKLTARENKEDELTPTPRSKFNRKRIVVAVITVVAIIYYFGSSKPDMSQQELAQVAKKQATLEAIANFDERLLACNEVVTAEPSEAFATCLNLAKEGDQIAKRRMVWAYSRATEYQDWQEVFNWLQALNYRDKGTQFLMYAIMHLLGDDESLKITGEKGINDLVTRNFAPANVFMASIYALGENQLPPSNNPLWLLERAYRKDPGAMDVSRLAVIYANNFLGASNLDKAGELLKEAAQQQYPVNANNVAWFLSTIDENPFTSSKLALELALNVNANVQHADNPIYVDTLAAAYAANDMFEEAVETQQKALDLLKVSDWSASRLEQEKVMYEERLMLYKQQEPLVEESIIVEKDVFFRKLKTGVIDYIFRAYLVRVNVPVLDTEAASK